MMFGKEVRESKRERDGGKTGERQNRGRGIRFTRDSQKAVKIEILTGEC
jgi:hypothetical protein